MAFFNLPFGVRIAGNAPIDGDRYIATDIASRDNLITIGRAYNGLQVFVESDKVLYILKDITIPTWEEVGADGDTISVTNGLSEITSGTFGLGGDLTEAVTFINGLGTKSLVLNEIQIFQLFTTGFVGSFTLDSNLTTLKAPSVSIINTAGKGLTISSNNTAILSADGLTITGGNGNTTIGSELDIFFQAGDGDGRGAKYIANPTILTDLTIPSWKNVLDANTSGLITASNGLNKVGNDIQLGGALTEDTEILGNSTHSLSLGTDLSRLSSFNIFGLGQSNIEAVGLQLSATVGTLELQGQNIFINNGFGSLGGAKYTTTIPNNQLTPLSIPSWENVEDVILTPNNGLSESNGTVGLGGTLIQDTTINGNNFFYNLLETSVVNIETLSTANPSKLILGQAGTELSSNSTDGLELSKITQTPGVTIIETRDDNVGLEKNSRIVTSTNSVELSTENASLVSNEFVLSDTIIEITDDINQKGIEYSADYSANYIDRSLVDKAYVDNLNVYDLNFVASANAPLSLALSIFGDATIVGTENKASQVTGVTYYGSTDGGDTFTLIGDHSLLIPWVGNNSGVVIYLKASMITTSTQLQVVNITYKKS